ncbi:MAG: Crp/Fnr family transcriptional regulator [Pleomorphochaeta sp.]
MKELINILKKCKVFSEKDEKEIESILLKINYKIKDYEEKDIILSPANKADNIGIILLGAVNIEKVFPTGKMILIERRQVGDLIGANSIFSKYEYSTNIVISCKASKILYIPKLDLLKLFLIDRKLMYNFIEILSNYSLMFEYKIGLLSLNSIKEKIAGYLIHALQFDEKIKTSSNIVELPFSKKDWAEFLNVSRTSLSRELKSLERERILTFDKRKIIINNMEKLNSIISY